MERKPIHQVRSHGSSCWEDISGESLDICRSMQEEYEIRTVYAEQPAPVAVVMIEAIERTRSLLANKNYPMGVDECIAIIKEVARLNGEKP